MKFLDKVVLITGAASGLGEAVALEIAREGASLALVDVNHDGLKICRDKILKQMPSAIISLYNADVSKEEAVKQYVDEVMNDYGSIHAFYNNAGVEGVQLSIADYDAFNFNKVIDINLLGVFYGLRYVIPVMLKQNYGMIVNCSSVGGLLGVTGRSAYVASKHAVIGLTKNVAIEYANDGIVCNAIAPGAIYTPMIDAAFKQMNPSDPKVAETLFVKNNPMKRLGSPEEVAKLVSFLLSGEVKYINGQTITIDGGQSIVY